MYQILPVVLTVLSLLEGSKAQTDLTTTPEAAGTNVVLATISRIEQTGVFPDDNRLLRRVAFAESRDGLDSDTFRQGYNGGIWQVDEANFLKTQNITAHPSLAGIFTRLSQSVFELEWGLAVWEDLRVPLISAVAARIFFEIAEDTIPDIGNVRGQGEFWKNSGFNTNDMDTVELFVERITALELEGTCMYIATCIIMST